MNTTLTFEPETFEFDLPARESNWEFETPKPPPALPYLKSFASSDARCVDALTRAGKTKIEALTLINAQIGLAIRMLRIAASRLKHGSRSASTTTVFRKIFKVPPTFVPSWFKPTATIQDRGDVVAVRCQRVADLLASGTLKLFCTINSTDCPDCPNDNTDFACSSWGDESVAPKRSNVICLGAPFWNDMKAGNKSSTLATLMHEPFHIYFGKYVTEHGTHPDGKTVGKFGGINCIVRFVFEVNSATTPQRVVDRCSSTVVRSAATGF